MIAVITLNMILMVIIIIIITIKKKKKSFKNIKFKVI